MRFLRRVSSFLNSFNNSNSISSSKNKMLNLIKNVMFGKIGIFAAGIIVFSILLIVILSTALSYLGYNVELMQMVDNGDIDSSSSLVAGDHMSIVEAAKTQLGQPYCTQGSVADPGGCGFNCSGLTWWAYEQVGYKIPHAQGYRSESFGFNGENSQAYWVHSKGHWKNNIDECNPGDLVFFSHSGTWQVTYHVAIYMGNHQIIHSGTGGVHISDYNSSGNFVGCGWPLEYENNESESIVIDGKNSKSKLTNSQRQTIVKTALAQVGKPYSHKNNPSQGFDCNGLASYSYEKAGLSTFNDGMSNRASDSYSCNQLSHIIRTSESNLLPGDVIGWACSNSGCAGLVGGACVPGGGTNGRHIAIYIGNGEIVHAAGYSSGIVRTKLSNLKPYWIAGPLV